MQFIVGDGSITYSTIVIDIISANKTVLLPLIANFNGLHSVLLILML